MLLHKNDIIPLKMVEVVILSKILSVAQLVTTVIFFSASDKSCVKWDTTPEIKTQQMRTLAGSSSTSLGLGIVDSRWPPLIETKSMWDSWRIFSVLDYILLRWINNYSILWYFRSEVKWNSALITQKLTHLEAKQ